MPAPLHQTLQSQRGHLISSHLLPSWRKDRRVVLMTGGSADGCSTQPSRPPRGQQCGSLCRPDQRSLRAEASNAPVPSSRPPPATPTRPHEWLGWRRAGLDIPQRACRHDRTGVQSSTLGNIADPLNSWRVAMVGNHPLGAEGRTDSEAQEAVSVLRVDAAHRAALQQEHAQILVHNDRTCGWNGRSACPARTAPPSPPPKSR